MKSFTIVAIALLFTALSSYGQIRLRGNIKNPTENQQLNVNIPFVFGYSDEANTKLPTNRDGNFNVLLPLDEEKIGYLRWGDHEALLWMRPGTDLAVELDGTSGEITFSGTMADANELLHELELRKAPLFFADNKRVAVNEMQDSVILPYLKQLDAKAAKVDTSTLSAREKEFLNAELHYHFTTYLDLYVRTARWPNDIWSPFILEVMNAETPQPKSPLRGPMYYAFIDTYLGLLETRAFSNRNDPARFAELLDSVYGVNSFDSLTAIYNQYGKTYIDWLAAKHAFDANTAERYLTKHIKEKYYNGDLSEGNYLLDALRMHNDKSVYLDTLTSEKRLLMEKMTHADNDIIIPDNYRTFSHIKTFVEQYRGKIVYLDIWGTWCGPCKIEMRHVPQLKERFAGKDVVFVYLDMDADNKDAKWREYIQVNGITGVHLRKNDEDIQAIWKELLPDDPAKHGYYPTYFLFDKNGNLAAETIKRPSDGEELVEQLEKYLNQ